MKSHFPGFLIHNNRNVSPRYRVRIAGNADRRTTIPVGPDHPGFPNHYYAARAGEHWKSTNKQPADRSLDWLEGRYLDFMRKMAEAGQMSPLVLRQPQSVLGRFCNHLNPEGTRYSDCNMVAPKSAFSEIRDACPPPALQTI